MWVLQTSTLCWRPLAGMWVASSVGNACAARVFPCWHAESWIPRWDCTVVDAPCWLVPRSWLISTFILLMIQIIPGTILVSWTFGEFLAWLHSGTWRWWWLILPSLKFMQVPQTGSFDGVEFQACTLRLFGQLSSSWPVLHCGPAAQPPSWQLSASTYKMPKKQIPEISFHNCRSGSCIFAWTDAMSVAWKASTSRDSIALTGFCKASIKHQPGQLLN